MLETIEERIERIDGMDITETPASELIEMISILNSDLIFVEYKKRYYTDFIHKLRTSKARLRSKLNDMPDVCEVCHIACTTDKLRTLPDPINRRVCKKCWTTEVCAIKLKNANNMMIGCTELSIKR